MTALLALDAGTTSTRALVFDADGAVRAVAQRPLALAYPQPGWVDVDAEAIRADTVAVAREAFAAAGHPRVAGVGIANQRETAVVWNRRTGRPVAPAIVWQDRRTADACARLAADGLDADVRDVTGLRLDPYFSATKIAWLLDHTDGARDAAARGDLLAGTVDSWLAWHLTGGPDGGRHVTDVTNASRTLLYDLRRRAWSAAMADALGVPLAVLPEVVPTAGDMGTTTAFGAPTALRALAGDQHAALFGQACLAPGAAKATYGTGAFLLMQTGREAPQSSHGLLTTVAWDLGDGPTYALEGSVFTAGAAVQWWRDAVGMVAAAGDTEALAAAVPDSGGAVFVPAFTGLGAPFWDPHARAALFGVTRGTTRDHLARAVLDAVAFSVRAVVDAMAADSGLALPSLRVDGGMTDNATLLQIQADVLGVPVERPALAEATAWGAAAFAGVAAGLFSPDVLAERWTAARRVTPSPVADARAGDYDRWRRAVDLARAWGDGSAP